MSLMEGRLPVNPGDYLRKKEMKPQCTTTAQCLKELARVMEQFEIAGVSYAIRSTYVKCRGEQFEGVIYPVPEFLTPSEWSFAIAEVEGKPVFPGDKLYDDCNVRHTVPVVTGAYPGHEVMTFPSGHKWTWQPKKPKTVMVEMLREDAEFFADNYRETFAQGGHGRIADACAKALKESE